MNHKTTDIEKRIRELVPELMEVHPIKIEHIIKLLSLLSVDFEINQRSFIGYAITIIFNHHGVGIDWMFDKHFSEQSEELKQFVGDLLFNDK